MLTVHHFLNASFAKEGWLGSRSATWKSYPNKGKLYDALQFEHCKGLRDLPPEELAEEIEGQIWGHVLDANLFLGRAVKLHVASRG